MYGSSKCDKNHLLSNTKILIWSEQIIEAVFDPTVQLHPWYRENFMAQHGLAKPQAQSSDGAKTSGGLSQNSITVETLARIPDLVHAPRAHHDEIQNLYDRARLDTEELVEKQAVLMKRLATGESISPTAAGMAVSQIIASCQTAHVMLLCICLGCNAMLSVLSPWDVSLTKDSARYRDDVLSLAKDVAPYRPLGASHFPLCLMAAYLTVTDSVKRKELEDLLIDFQKDFACSSWLDVATKARDSYWDSRRISVDLYKCDTGDGTREQLEKDASLCAVQ